MPKPPAKVISARKAAALSTGGGKLTPRIRKELDSKPTPRTRGLPRTRAGKREPKGGRHDHAAREATKPR